MVFIVAALAAAVINPYGVAAFEWPFRLMGMKSLTGSLEWTPLDLENVYDVFRIDIALLLCALMLPRKVHPIRAAIVIALFVMMCQHWRFGVVFDIITLLILATPFAKPIEQKRALDWRRSARVAILAVGLVGVTFGAESLTWPVVRGDGLVLVGSPVDGPANWALVYAELEAGLDAVPVALRSHRVANRWDYGPYLIFRGVKVMRDDRFELYGNEPMMFPDAWFDAAGVDWWFDTPNTGSDERCADPGWVSLARGDYVHVCARRSALLDAVKGGVP
jgi:hypothetical protein